MSLLTISQELQIDETTKITEKNQDDEENEK